jgi:hypothetical protein
MTTRACRAALICCAAIGLARAAAAQVDPQLAETFFADARAHCERDGGRLWGVSVCGPMVVGDIKTQTFATSQPAPDAPRPALVGIVNAPLQWGGATWGAYVWDFLVHETPEHRNEILLHELFHRVEPQLGLMLAAATSEHLDAADGRYWLRLEWRALARALRSTGASRTAAARDAITFRQARRALYSTAADSERPFEITEGLAQYTATVLAADSDQAATASAIDQLTRAEAQESFVKTFAYASGPAYGLLLDAASPQWRHTLRGSDDLGLLLANALAVQPTRDAAAAAMTYGGAELRTAEQQRERERQQRIADLRRRFVDGPLLVISGGGRGSIDSRGATVIPNAGTVYFGAFHWSGEWGALDAENGVLVASDGSSRRVSAPVPRGDTAAAGDGWTFAAAPGWIVREGPRRGDYEVVRRQP